MPRGPAGVNLARAKSPRYEQAQGDSRAWRDKEEAPETGDSGLLRFLMGGTCGGGGNTPPLQPK